jgi:hypothetical protein
MVVEPGSRSPAPPLSRREVLGWTLFGLLPISVPTALLVLHVMTGSAAAAGGCGGG